MRHFLEHQKPAVLISAGFAGAVGAGLSIGDLLLAENFSAPPLLTRARELLGNTVHVGPLATAGAVIDSVSDRAALAADSGAAAVDMETEFVAEACSAAGVPMLSMRGISDTAANPLPAPPRVLFDVARQKTNFLPLASHIARNPTAIWRLALFARRLTLVRRLMTAALCTLVQHEFGEAES
jgi:purine-nucleoside phosphorylase